MGERETNGNGALISLGKSFASQSRLSVLSHSLIPGFDSIRLNKCLNDDTWSFGMSLVLTSRTD